MTQVQPKTSELEEDNLRVIRNMIQISYWGKLNYIEDIHGQTTAKINQKSYFSKLAKEQFKQWLA